MLCPSCSKPLDASGAPCPHCQASAEPSTEKLGGPDWSWPTGDLGPAPVADSTQTSSQQWLGEMDPEDAPTAPLEDIYARPDEEEEDTHKILLIESQITRGSKELTTLLLIGMLLLGGSTVVQAMRGHLAPPVEVAGEGPHKGIAQAQLLLKSGDQLMESKDFKGAAIQFETALSHLKEAKGPAEQIRLIKSRLAEAYDSGGQYAKSHPLWMDLSKTEHFHERGLELASKAEKNLRVEAENLLASGEKALKSQELDRASKNAEQAYDLFHAYKGSSLQKARARALQGQAQLAAGKKRLAQASFAEAHSLAPKAGYDKGVKQAGGKVAVAVNPKPSLPRSKPSSVPKPQNIPQARSQTRSTNSAPAEKTRSQAQVASHSSSRALAPSRASSRPPKPKLGSLLAESDGSGRVTLTLQVSNPGDQISRSGRLVIKLSHSGPEVPGLSNPLKMEQDLPGIPPGRNAQIRINTPFESERALRGKKSSFPASNIEAGRSVPVKMSVKFKG